VELASIVVVPARDEQERIGNCLRALARQTLPMRAFETIVVLDACRDDTARIVREVGSVLGLPVRTIQGPGSGPGAARRVGMDAACARLLTLGRPQSLIACTDADSRPAPDWLERQLAHVSAGARAIAGLIELDDDEAGELPQAVLGRRERDAVARLWRVRRGDPDAGHHHFAGASIGVTAATYRDVGGIEPLTALEDAGFAARLTQHGVSILRAADVKVLTSARSDGRVARGLSVDLAVSTWSERRRYRAADFTPDGLREAKGDQSVTVIVPTKECAGTIEAVIRAAVGPSAERPLIDELVVVDAASQDRTADIAAAAGARVVQQDEILREHGAALGKGDAMWRALQVSGGEIVCFLDGDTVDPSPSHLRGLLGPLLIEPSLVLVKGAFERPLQAGGVTMPNEGGRVTELMARPLINLHEPLLAAFSQPLAGEFAARRELLEAIPFPVGYGVEIAVLIDALRRCGLQALAECHLGTRQNRHQPLRALGEMAYAVLAAMENRLPPRPITAAGHYLRPWEDGAVVSIPVHERPPIRARQSIPRERVSASST
jgi:glucosyl-3-phosphoglycerate synthase